MTASSPPPDVFASESCSILLVEDNFVNQKVVILMLSKYNIKPVVVDRGEKAVEAVQQQAFDMILMDLHMPGMGGLQAAASIRELLGEATPPIVALTADTVTGNEEAFEDKLIVGFLTKPISTEVLRACIETNTGKKLARSS